MNEFFVEETSIKYTPGTKSLVDTSYLLTFEIFLENIMTP